jgi:hypothetical protein
MRTLSLDDLISASRDSISGFALFRLVGMAQPSSSGS